ncbi:hypothetical protein SUGI_0262050 [Cryptomeria japonica]|uniref:pollen allergen Che a 1 n=1 Tax=Cryptomeria japonica TaxID=3369 RepID=UPI002408B699|nr:pollen allergen Che a 1 [Cryptomeria japonica]GLJ15871.1 hypothetical protein SUGI_0262050 [Cryptomeria japonica]
MAKMGVVAVICLLALLGVARASNTFSVTGKVYCDNCDAGFPTRISSGIEGATVALQCKDTDGKQTFYAEGVSDKDGKFRIPVQGERPRELCKAKALSSPNAKCNRPSEVNEGPVYLTHNNGINSDERITGPFSFKSAEKHPACATVMAEYNLY